jgi:hypothetical protein
MTEPPSYEFELRAADERKRLQASVVELRSRFKESLNVRKNVGDHVWLASAIVVLLGLFSGYAVAGLFVRH